MLKLLLSGVLCLSSIILLNYPFFTPPKQIIENKMPKKDWRNINSFQKKIKIQGQLQEIKKEKELLLNRGSKNKYKKTKKQKKKYSKKQKKKYSKKHL